MEPSVDVLLHSFLRAWPAAVLLFDLRRHVVFNNAAARALLEADLETLTPGERGERLTLRDDAGRLVPLDEFPSSRALQGQTVTAAEYQIVFADGRQRRVAIDAYPLRDARGDIVGAATVLVERSQSRPVMPYRLLEGLAKWLETSERTGGAIGTDPLVVATGRLLASSLDYDATLDTLLHAVVPRLADWCVIRVVDGDGGVRRLKTAYAMPEMADIAHAMDQYYAARTDLEAHAPSMGLGAVLRTGQPTLVSRVTDDWLRATANDEQHLALLRRLGPVSMMHVPLLARERTVGLMTFVRTVGQHYGMRQLALAEELCDRAAVAIENARLYRESQQRRHEAQALTDIARVLAETMDPRAVAQRIADSVRLLLEDTASAAVYSFQSVAEEARAVAVSSETAPRFQWTRVLPPGIGMVALAVSRRRTVAASDVLEHPDVFYTPRVRALLESSDYRALMAIPLIAHDRVLGALAVGARSGRRFEQREIALLSAFADHAAVSFDNARLFEEIDRRGRDAERARAAAEAANRSKDDFLAVLSHELRTPLTAILGWVRMLERGLLSEASAADALDAIERNTRLQARLINDLLDVSRIVTGKLEVERQPVHLASIVHDVVVSARQDTHARQVLQDADIDPDAGSVVGDRVRLQQVVTNLVSNAVKYTPRGGRVDVALRRAGDFAEIVVADTGEGIEPADLPLIFERFHQVDASKTRRHGGLGLGLTIVRHLVERHGGTVHAESPGRGRGSTFIVRLPRLTAPMALVKPAPRPSVTRAEAEMLRGIRALFVDDNEDARIFVRAALETAGAEVRVAQSAREGLGLFDAAPFDVVLTDIGMPDIDGYDFVRQLRATTRGARVPAIALTAYAGSDDERRALAAGFQRHIAKPIDPLDLVSAVRSVIEASAA